MKQFKTEKNKNEFFNSKTLSVLKNSLNVRMINKK
jgi:hypothetical protein